MTIFPLPLNAFEHYMLADDSAEYPRCFFIVVRLHGQLDEPQLREAIEVATKRHPLLRTLVEYEGDRPKRWIECREPRYTIDWKVESLDACEHERTIPPFDLRREPGLRIGVRRDGEGDSLGLEFHHACTDGLGGIQFIHDLLTIYGDVAMPLPKLDATRLARRNGFGLTGWRRPLRWLYGSLGWLGAIEFLAHRPAYLGSPPAVEITSARRASGFCRRSLTAEQTLAVIQGAKSEGVTVNDLVLRDTFLALQDTIECHWPERTRDHKRIMVPVSLRVAGDEQLPAANVVAMINLDRRPHRWIDLQQMLRVLHWELTAVKRLRLGVVFVQILHTLQTLFGSLRRFLPTDRCQSTCVVSNLGAVLPEHSANAIRAIEFYPPIRPLTAAAFGVATYGGRMMISLHYDAAAITSEQAAELIDRLVRRLRADSTDAQPTNAGGSLDEVGKEALLPSPS